MHSDIHRIDGIDVDFLTNTHGRLLNHSIRIYYSPVVDYFKADYFLGLFVEVSPSLSTSTRCIYRSTMRRER